MGWEVIEDGGRRNMNGGIAREREGGGEGRGEGRRAGGRGRGVGVFIREGGRNGGLDMVKVQTQKDAVQFGAMKGWGGCWGKYVNERGEMQCGSWSGGGVSKVGDRG